MERHKAKLVSFSGIDGAGKSTQIRALLDFLHETGMSTTLLTFWDDVVALPQLREFLSHKAFKGDKGVGSPENPIIRRDKNVSAWYTTAIRLVFYLLDTISLRLTFARVSRSDLDFIVFDRYIYDELANLPLQSGLMRAYIRFLLFLSPKPDAAFIVDADPEAAHRRKPEYPLDFVRRNRDAYIRISQLAGCMTVVGPLSVEETTSQIISHITGERSPSPQANESSIPMSHLSQ